jgi:hypothetical protein
MYPATHISMHFNQYWRSGLIEVKPIRVVDFKELALLYDLEDFIEEVDLPLRAQRNSEFLLETSSLKDVFYFALMTVIRQRGVNSKDRCFKNQKFLSLQELKSKTISGQLEKRHVLDSLYDLFIFAYRRCSGYFKQELSFLVTNKDHYYYYLWLFNQVYDRIVCGRKQLQGELHTKALLTTLLKKDVLQALKE